MTDTAEPNPFTLPGSPVRPVHVLAGRIIVEDFRGTMIALEPGRIMKNNLIALCGGDTWLKEQFPQYAKSEYSFEAKLVGFDQPRASAALIVACCNNSTRKGQG